MLILLFASSLNYGFAQQAAAVDSMKVKLDSAKTASEKVRILDYLSRTLMSVDLKEAEVYGKLMIQIAEESRDRELMIKAYKSNGVRCSYFAVQKEYVDRAIDFFNSALEIAKKEKIEKEIGGIQLNLAAMYLLVPDKDKALNYTNQANSLISTIADDSLNVESHNTYGRVYLARNDKTLSLRHYLTALRIAEEMHTESKNDKSNKASLLRSCFVFLAEFYAKIDDYDKAIDYYTLAYQKLDEINEENSAYQKVIDINTIGSLYSAKKNYDLAIVYFKRSVEMADTLDFVTLKIPGYVSLLNQYLNIKQPQKALEYMSSTQGMALKGYLQRFGFAGAIDHAYGVIYSDLNKYDSARYYFTKAIPFFENSSESASIEFYKQLAGFYSKAGEKDKAIEYYQKVKEIGERLGLLKNVQIAAKQLDSIYTLNGNYKLANEYNEIYYLYKDSIETLNKEKELTQLEAADELQRQERIVKEREESKKRRNNIQYMAITIGIVLLFIALVVLGMFKVSSTTIKMIGFFAFLMFFEFIFLIFKKNIYSITKGEPWKDLLFMIGLAAVLLPLHHWLEHRVIKYLTSHNRLTSAGHHIKRKFFGRSKNTEQ